MSLNTIGYEGQLDQKDITPQVFVAYHNKIDFKEVPVSIQHIDDIPSFIFELGNLQGIMPVHETGYFDGTLEDYKNLSVIDKRRITNIMAQSLASGNPLWLRVIKIDNGIATLSRKEALKSVKQRTLKYFGVKEEKDLIGKTVKAVVTRVTKKGAYFDIGGIEAYMPRSEIGHNSPYPHDVLIAGQSDGQKVNGFKEVKVIDYKEQLIISRKACLTAPKKDIQEGMIVRGKVMGFSTYNGRYIVITDDGLKVSANNPPYRPVPDRFSTVSVRIIRVTPKMVAGAIIA